MRMRRGFRPATSSRSSSSRDGVGAASGGDGGVVMMMMGMAVVMVVAVVHVEAAASFQVPPAATTTNPLSRTSTRSSGRLFQSTIFPPTRSTTSHNDTDTTSLLNGYYQSKGSAISSTSTAEKAAQLRALLDEAVMAYQDSSSASTFQQEIQELIQDMSHALSSVVTAAEKDKEETSTTKRTRLLVARELEDAFSLYMKDSTESNQNRMDQLAAEYQLLMQQQQNEEDNNHRSHALSSVSTVAEETTATSSSSSTTSERTRLQVARELEDAFAMNMKDPTESNQNRMDQLAAEYQLLMQQPQQQNEGQNNNNNNLNHQVEEETPSPLAAVVNNAAMESYRQRLDQIKREMPPKPMPTTFVVRQQNNGETKKNGHEPPQPVVVRNRNQKKVGRSSPPAPIAFEGGEKPDEQTLLQLLDQGTLLFSSIVNNHNNNNNHDNNHQNNAPKNVVENESLRDDVEELIEEIGQYIYYSKQPEAKKKTNDIVAEDVVQKANGAESKQQQPRPDEEETTKSVVLPTTHGRTRIQIAQELEAALQQHMTLGDDASAAILEELAAEYNRAVAMEKNRKDDSNGNDSVEEAVADEILSPPVTTKLEDANNSLMIVSAASVVASLQERLDAVQQKMGVRIINTAVPSSSDNTVATTIPVVDVPPPVPTPVSSVSVQQQPPKKAAFINQDEKKKADEEDSIQKKKSHDSARALLERRLAMERNQKKATTSSSPVSKASTSTVFQQDDDDSEDLTLAMEFDKLASKPAAPAVAAVSSEAAANFVTTISTTATTAIGEEVEVSPGDLAREAAEFDKLATTKSTPPPATTTTESLLFDESAKAAVASEEATTNAITSSSDRTINVELPSSSAQEVEVSSPVVVDVDLALDAEEFDKLATTKDRSTTTKTSSRDAEETNRQVQKALEEAELALAFADASSAKKNNNESGGSDEKTKKKRRAKLIHEIAGRAMNSSIRGAIALVNLVKESAAKHGPVTFSGALGELQQGPPPARELEVIGTTTMKEDDDDATPSPPKYPPLFYANVTTTTNSKVRMTARNADDESAAIENSSASRQSDAAILTDLDYDDAAFLTDLDDNDDDNNRTDVSATASPRTATTSTSSRDGPSSSNGMYFADAPTKSRAPMHQRTEERVAAADKSKPLAFFQRSDDITEEQEGGKNTHGAQQVIEEQLNTFRHAWKDFVVNVQAVSQGLTKAADATLGSSLFHGEDRQSRKELVPNTTVFYDSRGGGAAAMQNLAQRLSLADRQQASEATSLAFAAVIYPFLVRRLAPTVVLCAVILPHCYLLLRNQH